MAKDDEDIIKNLKQTLESMRKAASSFEDSMEGVSKEVREGLKEELKLLTEKLETLKKSSTASDKQKSRRRRNS
jgi:DNA repair exonuclease SbcCD ATPase subunit